MRWEQRTRSVPRLNFLRAEFRCSPAGSPPTNAELRQGLNFTVLSNTSASPIIGSFSNLPDRAILTVNGNNFQASYAGGYGNDLTLTVVP